MGATLSGAPQPKRFAWVVTPQGFGHAPRTSAIVEALGRRLPQVEVELWTSVPKWFFDESLTVAFRRRELACDVGLIQKSPVEEDLPASLSALASFWGAAESFRTREVAAAVAASGASCVIADIAPFGLDVARAAGLPSVLVENFTWDWIYEPLTAAEPRFAVWAERLRAKFAQADLHLQLEPCCRPSVSTSVAPPLPPLPPLPPVARRPRRSREEIAARLGIPAGEAIVLVSFGGVEHQLANLDPLARHAGATFVIPGGRPEEKWEGNLRLLPHHSPVYHPDLVAAADVVVGKLGYSTVAEAMAAHSRMLFVPRPGFRESAVLEEYVLRRLPAEAMPLAELESGAWVERLAGVLARPRPAGAAGAAGAAGDSLRGAEVAAQRIAAWWEARGRAAAGPAADRSGGRIADPAAGE